MTIGREATISVRQNFLKADIDKKKLIEKYWRNQRVDSIEFRHWIQTLDSDIGFVVKSRRIDVSVLAISDYYPRLEELYWNSTQLIL